MNPGANRLFLRCDRPSANVLVRGKGSVSLNTCPGMCGLLSQLSSRIEQVVCVVDLR